MTPNQRRNLLRKFEEAASEFAFRGAKHPEDAAYWEVRYMKLRALLAKELSVELLSVEDEEEFTS